MFYLQKLYKINITFCEGKKEFVDSIIAKQVFGGFFYQELITGESFYPLYRFPITLNECLHNGNYMNGDNEINRQITQKGYSMIMFLDDNKEIKEVIDEQVIKDYYQNFPSSNFSKYIGKDIQKKKIRGRK